MSVDPMAEVASACGHANRVLQECIHDLTVEGSSEEIALGRYNAVLQLSFLGASTALIANECINQLRTVQEAAQKHAPGDPRTEEMVRGIGHQIGQIQHAWEGEVHG